MDQHSPARSVVLHLAPGAAVLAGALGLTPVAAALGLPAVAALFAAVLLVLVPVELGYLHHRARREGTTVRGLLDNRGVPGPRRFVGPVVEELYFRGYLLPRMARLGRAAPVVNAFLFSAYHLFAPWQLVSRFLFALPFVHAVWRTRSTVLGIVVHVVDDVVSMALLLLVHVAAVS